MKTAATLQSISDLLEHTIVPHLQRIDAKLMEHDRRFDAIEKRLDQHDKRFERIEKRLDEHDRRFDQLEKRLDEHDRHFDQLEKKLDGHGKQFVLLNKQLKEVRENQDTLEFLLRDTHARMIRVEQDVSGLKDELFSLKDWVTGRITILEDELKLVVARLADLHDKLEGFTVQDYRETRHRVYGLSLRLDVLQNEVKALKAKKAED